METQEDKIGNEIKEAFNEKCKEAMGHSKMAVAHRYLSKVTLVQGEMDDLIRTMTGQVSMERYNDAGGSLAGFYEKMMTLEEHLSGFAEVIKYETNLATLILPGGEIDPADFDPADKVPQ